LENLNQFAIKSSTNFKDPKANIILIINALAIDLSPINLALKHHWIEYSTFVLLRIDF